METPTASPTTSLLAATLLLAAAGAADILRVAGRLGGHDLLLVGLGALPVAVFAAVAMRQRA